MCGFAGEFTFARAGLTVDVACAMADRLTHRGPDERGRFLSADGRCAIGFCRLAVIDPQGSHQPMTSLDGNVTVAFNGEIYNFRQLRSELAAQGAVFRTEGDTEALLHLYVRDGAAMFDALRGMFAIAIYDAREGKVLLARDRLGQKPLWYAFTHDRVVFASEAKAVLVHPGVGKQVRRQSLTHYCTMGYVGWPETIWADLLKLPPAGVLELTDRPAKCRRFWQPGLIDLPESPHERMELVRQSVRNAVTAQLVSDVPLGALLSGGLDSSIVVALMSKQAGRAGGVRTFTAGFADGDYDERPAARLVAQHCRTDHTELLVRPEPAGALDRIVAMYDEPFADSSALPTWLICRAARQHVTVALAGDGGDEVFGGYDRYRALLLAERMGPIKYLAIRAAAKVIGPFAPADERSWRHRLVRFAEAIPLPHAMQYFSYRSLFSADDLARLLTEEFADGLNLDEPTEWFCDIYEDFEVDSEVTRAQLHDMHTYLPDDLLVKTDIASMASSLELRSPLLDHRLVQIGLSLSDDEKIARGRGKAILRRAFADMLPAETIRRPKQGFGVPLAGWLRNELRDEMCDVLLDDSLTGRGIFRREALEGLINDHLSGRDHHHRLWALMVLARCLVRQD
jgi:asparagine synthase (glutamine-hydrolysing)